ncbi:MAG: VWA domain-containing protein [Bacteroidota bacterium]
MEDFLQKFFVYPEYWPVVLVVPPLVVVIFVIFNKSYQAMRIWFRPADYTFFMPELKLAVRTIALLFLFLALSGPYWGRMEQQIAKLGREVYILMDVSASMNTEDIKPSRLEKVKKEVKKMVSRLKGDKIGLIVFTSDAYVQCPLTSDHKAVLMFLDLVGSYQFANTGTSFREAMKMALDRFTNTETTAQKTTRSVVLISDGEDFGENYTSVSDRLKNNDITVFTVGVGTYSGGPVPNLVKGKKRGYKKDPETGGTAMSQLKDETLREIADKFGTDYHMIDDQIDNLQPVSDQISLLSATVMDKENRLTSVNRYQWFLAIAVLCIMISMFWLPLSASRNSGKR